MYLKTALSPIAETIEPRKWKNQWRLYVTMEDCRCTECKKSMSVQAGEVLTECCGVHPTEADAVYDAQVTHHPSKYGWPDGTIEYLGPVEIT